jgi:hypothetical protein
MKSGTLALLAGSILLGLGLQAPVQAQTEQSDTQGIGEAREGRFHRGGFGRGGAGPRMAPRDGAQLLERFDTLDTNDDSRLDQDELLAGPQRRIEAMFTCLDADADGFLTTEELATTREGGREARRALRDCLQDVGATEGF